MTAEALYQTLLSYTSNPFILLSAIFWTTFVLEEGAAALAVLLVLAEKLSLPTATTAVFLGVVASDIGLYILGYAASHFKWVRRWVDVVKLRQGDEWMQQSLLPLVILCRFLPWALPPMFIACGFFGLPFTRLVWLSAVSAALWTVVVVGSMLGFGLFMLDHPESWGWGGALLVLLIVVYSRRRKEALEPPPQKKPEVIEGKDIPPTWPQNQTVCWYERMPAWLFYTPVVLYWLGLALRYRSLTLPTAANPSFEVGGLVGESKLQVLAQVSARVVNWFAPHTALTRSSEPGSAVLDTQRALQALAAAGLDFPLVAKPDRGHHGHGVRPIDGSEALASYIATFPPGEIIVLQKRILFDGEAGVFYVRLPGTSSGRIFSLNLSEPAQVTGDGETTLGTLITVHPSMAHSQILHLATHKDRLDWIPAAGEHVVLAFARSHRLGAILRDGRQYVTPALLERFDQIANGIPGFYFGRFEVRFRQLDAFQRGEDFQIVEINGAGAEANHIWDRNSRLRDAYRTLFEQYRLAFQIGHLNRQQGARPMPLVQLWQVFQRQQALLKQYIRSDAGVVAHE